MNQSIHHSLAHWIPFTIVITLLIIFDLIYSSQKKVISFRKSLYLCVLYITIACLYGIYIYLYISPDKASEYYTGFFIEKAMALDNIFIFSIIFKFLNIAKEAQHRILFWGIIGVLFFRGIMIGAGSALLNQYDWILYVLAIILIISGIKMFIISSHSFTVENTNIYKFLTRNINFLHVTDQGFFIKKDGRIYATTAFLALLLIETMDVIFAIDSVPAIFAITNDTFIIYTSNIFAILGLRAMYSCLAEMIERFSYLKYSLALILIFIGCKILLSHIWHISSLTSLFVTLILLFGGIVLSICSKNNIRS